MKNAYLDKSNRPRPKPLKLFQFFSRFLKSTYAASAIEYLSLIGGIAVTIIFSTSALRRSTNNAFKKVSNEIVGHWYDQSFTKI